jgi:glycosyltransferase involved in cell wall biosynthesis
MKLKVSIGICARNCESFIKETINSIAAQDYPPNLMELIFVDDGSEDKTLEIVQNCLSQIDISSKVFHTPWKGLGHARNIVVTHAKGKYILWIDGDMIISKNYVSRLIEFMEKNPRIGIAKGKQALKIGSSLLATLEAYSRAAGRMLDYLSPKARYKSLGTGGAIYRKEIFEKIGKFDENLKGYGEDSDIEIRAKNAGFLLTTVNVNFSDFERHGLTWKNLWEKYWLRGYYGYYFFHKHKSLLKHYRMIPPAAFLAGIYASFKLYRLTGLKAVFLIPFLNIFKTTAWYIGFLTRELKKVSVSKQSRIRDIHLCKNYSYK